MLRQLLSYEKAFKNLPLSSDSEDEEEGDNSDSFIIETDMGILLFDNVPPWLGCCAHLHQLGIGDGITEGYAFSRIANALAN